MINTNSTPAGIDAIGEREEADLAAQSSVPGTSSGPLTKPLGAGSGSALFDAPATSPADLGMDMVPLAGTSSVSGVGGTFTLELLHIADQEAGSEAVIDAPNLSAVLNALRDEDLGGDGLADHTLTLSSGDAFIPGVFFEASETVFGSRGIADIQIQNELGIQAMALGNHEFDLGTSFLSGLIDGSVPGDFSALSGTALDGLDFEGTDFPYLSTNLDFSTDANLAPLQISGGLAPQPNVVTSSTIADANGESIGVVGATTPVVGSISSPGDVGISPVWAGGTPTDAELDALAAEIQAEVDTLLTANPALNKVILLAHMQQLSIETGLAERLTDVDIIVAGGSNTRLFDDNDRARDGDSDQGQYPTFVTNAGGTTTAVVNTDGSYKYVGRLVLDFDADGNIDPSSYDETVSGAYATDAQGVADLGAEGLIDPEIQAIADAIEAQIISTEGNVFGVSDVFLNGNRSGTFTADDPDGVRTQETNLGNLTADANLAIAKTFDPTTLISIKNGGGIRASIGEVVVPAGGTEAVRQPNSEIVDGDGNVVKPEGGISQTDIQSTLAFNNGLVLIDMTRAELATLLESSVSALPDVNGGFPQVSGIRFSFDETAPVGSRLVNADVFDETTGQPLAQLVRDGIVVGNPNEVFRVVTLDFLVDFGDPILSQLNEANLSNPNRLNLQDLDADGVEDGIMTGAATFADDGTEQDALAEYLNDNFNPANGGVSFALADTGPEGDERIQNLSFRLDTLAPSTELFDITVAQVLDSGQGEGGSEVVVHENGLLYVTNGSRGGIDVWDIATGALADFYDLTFLPGFAGVQSVAVANGIIAAAVSTPDIDNGDGTTTAQNGYVALIDAASGQVFDRVTVGNLPDMVTFTPDGTKILVANEGERNGNSSLAEDPVGSVAIIDVSNLIDPVAEIVSFDGLITLSEAMDAGIRLSPAVGSSEDIALDLEPEYIAVAPDGLVAYVGLQENNAVAVLDLQIGSFTDILPLGSVNHNVPGFEIDPNDQDGVINISNFANLRGLRMPDGIDAFEAGGQTFFITANEGDGRGDFDETFGDEARVSDILNGLVPGLTIDPGLDTTNLERLTVSIIDGDLGDTVDIDRLFAFGSRSFSIFDADGNLVFDSGSQFENIIADRFPERFNDDDGDDGEDRSDNKGPEPEAVTVGEIDGNLYAFIGLERDSGVMIYNITDPANAFFVDYIAGFGAVDGTGAEDFIAPETISFIPADESTSGLPQIAVAYEQSGVTVVYDLGTMGAPQPILINEFQPNPEGQDPADTDVELLGTPGESFDLWLLSVENDTPNGLVDRATNVTGTFDTNGLAVVTIPDLENPSFTFLLTDDFTGVAGVTDIDADDDGVVDDISTFGTVLDAIGVPDSDSDADILYASQLGGTDFAFTGDEPRLIFRDGTDPSLLFAVNDPANDQVFDVAGNAFSSAAFDFDPTAGTDTFGAPSPSFIGEPAAFDLQVTEMWFGQDGSDLTADWFEITNVGTGAWLASRDGVLFYDDESADPTVADAVMGITEIAPGESVIVVIGDAADVTTFQNVWGATDPALDPLVGDIQIGTADGAGLGQGGDAVNLFLDAEADGLALTDTPVETESYPDATGNSGRSWDVGSGQFSDPALLDGVVVTDATAGTTSTEPAVASPGTVPTPIVVDPVTPIGVVQGTGDVSGFVGDTVTIEGVVTAVFMENQEIGGFFIQDSAYLDGASFEQLGDNDPATSDGIFVSWSGDVPARFDIVTVTGVVSEFFDRTQIMADTVIDTTADATQIVAQVIDPRFDDTTLEALEGMEVFITNTDTGLFEVTEVFTLGRFGEFEAAPAANVVPTQVIDPGQAGSDAAILDMTERNFEDRIVVDDGAFNQNPDVKVLIDDGAETGAVDGAYDTLDNPGPTLRAGNVFTSIPGVLDFAFGEYRVHYEFDAPDIGGPLTPLFGTERPDTPDVGGTLQVASFNVQNFFTTLDDGSMSPIGGTPRGADSMEEFDRQLDKLVTTILDLDADIIGLQEIENNGFGSGSAISVLTDALNTETGTTQWSFIDLSAEAGNVDGFIGTDVITNGFLYRNDTLDNTGKAVLVFDDTGAGTVGAQTQALADVLNPVASPDDQVSFSQLNRPAIAATFTDMSGNVVTVVNNHFKSKGDSNLFDLFADAQAHVDGGGSVITQADIDAFLADPNFDQGDGQGFWNAIRSAAAAELTAWLGTDPTGSGDEDVLIIGDLNAYGLEDPVDTVIAGGFDHTLGGDADDYSFSFFGQRGALDHALASGSLATQITGADYWHINADEPAFLDYNLEFEDPAFFNPDDPFRSSDHDPLLVGLALATPSASDFVVGLANADGDAQVATLTDGAVIDPLAVADGDRTITAAYIGDGDPNDDDGSIRFRLFRDGELVKEQIENIIPFALFGDEDGDLNGAVPPSAALIDGRYTLELTAFSENKAGGVEISSETLSFVLGDPVELLTLSIDADAIAENGGATTATVARGGDTTAPLTVTLVSSDPSEATTDMSVTIAAGDTSADIVILAQDDDLDDGDQPVTFTATAAGFTTATDNVTVLDDDMAQTQQVTVKATVDGEQKNGILDLLQTVSDNDIEVGGGDIGGFLFEDVLIPDGATISEVVLRLGSQRIQFVDADIDIRLFNSASVSASGAGLPDFEDPGFEVLDVTPFDLNGVFSSTDIIETPDLSAPVAALVAANPGAGAFDFLFTLEAESGIARFDPAEFPDDDATLVITYVPGADVM